LISHSLNSRSQKRQYFSSPKTGLWHSVLAQIFGGWYFSFACKATAVWFWASIVFISSSCSSSPWFSLARIWAWNSSFSSKLGGVLVGSSCFSCFGSLVSGSGKLATKGWNLN
jgi:hypothetical protein